MARMPQRAASVLCAALLLSAVSVDGAGLWGGAKKSADVKVATATKAVAAATPKAVVPAGDGHNVYWCARLEMRAQRGACVPHTAPGHTDADRASQVQRGDGRSVRDGPAG
jgi:hypothetical protein